MTITFKIPEKFIGTEYEAAMREMVDNCNSGKSKGIVVYGGMCIEDFILEDTDEHRA